MKPHPFELDSLDHVAIRVKDLEISANWYETVLGFARIQFEEWGDLPIFMVQKNFGVALFPANIKDPSIPVSKNVKIDHFAFQVSHEHYNKAKNHFTDIGLSFEEQDHHHFMSIYFLDPDGHQCEITKIKGLQFPFSK